MYTKEEQKEFYEKHFNKPLTEIQETNIKALYKEFPVGAKRLFKIYNEVFGEKSIYRKQVETWLKKNKIDKSIITKEENIFLNDLYYKKHNYFGVLKLYKLANQTMKISRRKIEEWLKLQKTYQIHKPINFKRRNTKSFKSLSSSTLAIDLIDMTSKKFKHFQYILTCIDIFSRYTYLFALTKKTPENVEEKLKQVLKHHKFKVIITDNGTEFNISIPDVKIIKTQTYNPTNNAIVERQNRNVRELLRKFFENNTNWPAVLNTFAENLNNTYQSYLKDTPTNVFKNYNEQQLEVLKERLQKNFNNRKTLRPEKVLKLGDNVRTINRVKIKTKNKHLPNWSLDTYVIYKVIPAKENVLTRYKLVNTSNGKIETGTYNSSELQLIKGIINAPT